MPLLTIVLVLIGLEYCYVRQQLYSHGRKDQKRTEPGRRNHCGRLVGANVRNNRFVKSLANSLMRRHHPLAPLARWSPLRPVNSAALRARVRRGSSASRWE